MKYIPLKELRNKPVQKKFKSSGIFECLTGKVEIKKHEVVTYRKKVKKPQLVKKIKILVIDGAENCPKCKVKMERRTHIDMPTKDFYYTRWDYCKPCGHIQHYEEFKSATWKESEQNQRHFKGIKNDTQI